MNKLMKKMLLIACILPLIGWGSAYDENKVREKGSEQADRARQGDDEDIKRTQGDESGRRSIHEQGPLQDDERGRW